MRDVTAEEVRQAVLDSGVSRIDSHDCSICHSMVGFNISDGRIFWDSNCGCTVHSSEPELRSWDSIAENVNMQTNEENKRRVAKRFFVDIDQPAPEVRPVEVEPDSFYDKVVEEVTALLSDIQYDGDIDHNNSGYGSVYVFLTQEREETDQWSHLPPTHPVWWQLFYLIVCNGGWNVGGWGVISSMGGPFKQGLEQNEAIQLIYYKGWADGATVAGVDVYAALEQPFKRFITLHEEAHAVASQG